MNNTRMGCLSANGLVTAAITLLVLSGLYVFQGGVMFNPGALRAAAGKELTPGIRSHDDTQGNCASCHPSPFGEETMSQRCLVCHEGIKDEFTRPDSLHGALSEIMSQIDCLACHTEHSGPEAPLTRLELADFPHQATGFSLQGHQRQADGSTFSCRDCHSTSFARFDPATCQICHLLLNPAYQNDHLAAFGGDCQGCHDGVDRYGPLFDHQSLAFPLEGQHLTTSCQGCHPGASSPEDLQSTPLICNACHAQDDAHQGRLGTDCAACHTPQDWNEAIFDHSLAGFQLTGAHVQVPCTSCHEGDGFSGTPRECPACHAEPGYHLGLFSLQCESCHTPDAWRPALFDQVHRFPLNHGRPTISDCQICHSDRLQTYGCYGCHEHDPADIEEEHRKEGIVDFQDCARCHPTGLKEEGERGGNGDDD